MGNRGSGLDTWRQRAAALLLPVIVFATGLGITSGLARWRAATDDREAQSRFETLAHSSAADIERTLIRYADLLIAASAFQSQSDGQPKAAFASFAQGLDLDQSFPGLKTITFIARVPVGDVARFEAARRADGAIDFTVRPDAAAPPRSAYQVVTYSAPVRSRSEGLDLGGVPGRAAALDRAVQTGLPSMTEPITLVDDQQLPVEQRKPAFAIFVPVFRTGLPIATEEQRADALIGWTASAVRADDFFGPLGEPQSHAVGYVVTDDGKPLKRSDPAVASQIAEGARQTDLPVSAFGRTWAFRFVALPGFTGGRSSTSAAIVVGGVLASILLALLVFVLADQRRRLRVRVRASLGESVELRRRFQSAFDDAPIGVAMIGLDGEVLRANRVLLGMLGRSQGPVNARDIVHPDDLETAESSLLALTTGATDRVELELRFLRGTDDQDPRVGEGVRSDVAPVVFWTHVSASPVLNRAGGVDYIVAHVVDRTDRREEAERLRMAEVRFRTAFDHATTGIALISPSGSYLQVNEALCRILARSEDELLSMDFVDVRHPDDVAGSVDLRERMLLGEVDAETYELRYVRPGGEVVWGRTSASAVRNDVGEVLYFLHLTEDITAERHAEEELGRRQRWFEALVEHATDVVCLLAPDGMIQWVSPSAQRVLGYGFDKVGTSMADLLHPGDRTRVIEAFRQIAIDPAPGGAIEFRIAHADGSWRYFETIATNLLDDPDVGAIVANSRDVTERAEAAEQLSHRASHDPLTGLANRELLLERMAEGLDKARRSGGAVAALYLDIDRFKMINDRYGHAAGDRVLQAVAAQLLRTVRPGDTVARLGGDEFVVLAEGVSGSADFLMLAERLRAAASDPVLLSTGDRVDPTLSAGVAVAHGPTLPDMLLRDADAALYRAKERGKDRCELFDASLRAAGVRRLGTELLLHQALDQGELVVHYQPILDLATADVVAVEALLRLERSTGELVVPEEFLQVAEETGLIVTIGAGVFDAAYHQMASWRLALGDRAPARVNVNLSARQLAHPGLMNHLTRAIASSGIGAEMVGLELAEPTLRDASNAALAVLQDLRGLGITIAVDGFGNGQTSLTAMQWLPVDIVKIDRGLVRGLRGSPAPADVATVRAIIDVADSCGLTTVGVGVEDETELAMLRELGCRRAQGYLFGVPVPAAVLEHELASLRPLWSNLASPS